MYLCKCVYVYVYIWFRLFLVVTLRVSQMNVYAAVAHNDGSKRRRAIYGSRLHERLAYRLHLGFDLGINSAM